MKNIEEINEMDSHKQLSPALLEDIWVKARELFI
jgi:hypothetical protein